MNRLRISTRWWALCLLMLIISSIVISIVPIPKAAAETADNYTFQWVDGGHIKEFTGGSGGPSFTYTAANPHSGVNNYVRPATAMCGATTLTADTTNPANGVISGGVIPSQAGCNTDPANTFEARLLIPQNATKGLPAASKSGGATNSYKTAKYNWTSANSISVTGSVNATFKAQTSASTPTTDDTYVRTGQSGSCPDKIVFPVGGANTSATLTYGQTSSKDSGGNTVCSGGSPVPITIGDASKGAKAGAKQTATTSTTPVVSSSSIDSSDDTPTCESSGWSMNWLFCIMYDGLAHASDWVLTSLIEPELRTSPLCISSSGTGCEKNDVTFKVWSNFRIYGDVFLVVALLVVVFGQSIGGGLIDAYTVKKMIPRILAAAILINLSIYIVAFFLDMANIIGGGIGQLITSPLTDARAFNISPQGGVGAGELAAGGLVVGFLGAKGLAGIFTHEGVSMVLNVVLLPTFLLFLAIIATIAIRKAIIIALVFVSPVAFALYTLPNTEKYFKRWWSLLMEMLTIYPIIVLLFAVSDVLSVTVMQPGASNDATAGVNYLLSFVFLVIPLFLIPFSFKIAGGVLGRVHDLVDNGRKQAHALNEGRRERAKANFKGANIQARQNRTAALNRFASKGDRDTFAGRMRHRTLGRGASLLSRGYGGYNIEADASAHRAQVAKEVNDQIATGDDKAVRGLTVNKKKSASRFNEETGRMQYMSLGGQWVDEADVDEGHRRWGNNTYAQQAALAYEMRKASSEEELQNLATNYNTVAQGPGGWGMSDQQAGGAWVGAAFEHQNQHLEYKHTDWKTGKMSEEGAKKFVNEVYEKKGSYPLAQMSSNTIEQLKEAHSMLGGDAEYSGKMAQIAETFMNDYGTGGGDAEEAAARAAAATASGAGLAGAAGPGISRRKSNTPGAAHVGERVKEFAVLTGVHPDAIPDGIPNAAGPPSRSGESPQGPYGNSQN